MDADGEEEQANEFEDEDDDYVWKDGNYEDEGDDLELEDEFEDEEVAKTFNSKRR